MLRCAGLDERDVRRVPPRARRARHGRPRRLVRDRARRRPVQRQRPARHEVRRSQQRVEAELRDLAAARRRGGLPVPRRLLRHRRARLPARRASSTGRTASRSAPCAITLTDAGRADPLLGAAAADVRRLPRPQGGGDPAARRRGAARLARPPARCRPSGSASNVYATQFHPELDVDGPVPAHRRLPPPRLLRPARRPRSCWPMARASRVEHPPRLLATVRRALRPLTDIQ